MSRATHLTLGALLVVASVASAACRDKSDDASDDDPKPKRSRLKGEKIEALTTLFGAGSPGASPAPSAIASTAPSAAASSAPSRARSDALVEDYDFGTVAWTFGGDGAVRVDVKDKSKAPLKDAAEIDLKVGPADAQTSVSLTTVDGTATYSASLPAFTADLTPVDYSIKIDGKSYAGTLHVPAGGTRAIVAVDPSAPAVVVAADAKGPHGGVVQVVGEDRLELVSDEDTREVRVFVLDADLQPIAVGDRAVTIGVVADRAEIVPLAIEPGGLYFTARWGIEVDPMRITLGVHVGPAFHVAIVGWHPGVHLVAGIGAPVFAVRVRTGWGPPARAFVGGHWVAWDHRWDHDVRRGVDRPHVGEVRGRVVGVDRPGAPRDHEAHPHPGVAPPAGHHEAAGKKPKR